MVARGGPTPGGSGTANGSGSSSDGTASDRSLPDLSGYFDLLVSPDTETAMARARSASDAGLLRRKGHLKEQDRWIDYIRKMHETHTCEEVMAKMERWIAVRACAARARAK
jgi:IMP and pyridine-specific 5'-nucleotidase